MIIDTILKAIEEKGMNKTEAAAAAGMSRQNFQDKISNGNPRFNSVNLIMSGLGYDTHIERDTDLPGGSLEQCEDRVLQALWETNLCFDDVQKVLRSLGVKVIFTERAQKGRNGNEISK